MQDDLSKKIVEAIKERNISPTPKWHFMAKECSVWTFGVALVIIGSLAFSVVLFLIVNNDWEIHEAIHESFLGFIFLSLPYFWLLLLGLFIIATEYNIRHTKKGYTYSLSHIVVVILIANVAGGTILYNAGFAEAFDAKLLQKSPHYYNQIVGKRHHRWESPEQGRLAGRVQRVDPKSIILQDIKGNEWEVIISDSRIATGTPNSPSRTPT